MTNRAVQSMHMQSFFATTAKGIEPLLAEELRAFGADAVKPAGGGVGFQGSLATAYRACLWSRTASRVLLPLASFGAPDQDALYEGAGAIAWEEHLSPDGTLAVDFTGTGSRIRHTQFGARRVKDAVADRFRQRYGRRPSVDLDRPDIRINTHLWGDKATISLDLSGDSLHRRGYRRETVAAPLKETLAAALLMKIGWPDIAAAGGPLLDPMCGSGTLPIEAALMAADIAPGLARHYWGFLGWLRHSSATWRDLCTEAHGRRADGISKLPPITGYDRDARAIAAARANAGHAGLAEAIRFEHRALAHAVSPGRGKPGLLIVNPPYGERLGELPELESLYAQLGDLLKAHFVGWQAAVFTANPELGKRMGLQARRLNRFYNGALPCKLLRFQVEPRYFVDRAAADARKSQALLASAAPFVNRLRKNLRTLGAWTAREGIHCYRLYDADIPEYAVAVDIYEQWVHVQEYAPPRSVDSARAGERLGQIMAALPQVLETPSERIFLKIRQPQKGIEQYRKQAERGHFIEVREGPCRFLVNLSDYLDTGLFLDHRETRRMLGELAEGRRFLNLFAYTGTATVWAARNSAKTTTSVDLSRTYLDWARRNLDLNGIDGRDHSLIQADCLAWLRDAQERFDLIFLDPPTFSNSKRMAESFDLQRNHVALIHAALARLAPGGVLLFSNNYRRFKLDRKALGEVSIENITQRTLPRDFQRNPRIHNCWKITQRSTASAPVPSNPWAGSRRRPFPR